MYTHFQVGGGAPMSIDASSLDFSGTSQTELGIDNMGVGDVRGVNLFKSGINENSLAFGKVSMTYLGEDQFSISSDLFDFNIEWQNGVTARNIGTVVGAGINYNQFLGPASSIVPLIGGGAYNVYFNGSVTIPKD